jgi:2-dehydro-3-deoxygluconokinase
MGLYFLETGAVRRPSRIVYDRAGSVFVETAASQYDWPALLDGSEWLHLSGITPAVGPEPARAALLAVKAAKAVDVRVSFDGNYRQALWEAWGGDGPATICEILESVDTAFINERDIALLLGSAPEPRAVAVERAFAAFTNLQRIAATRREQSSVADQVLSGDLFTREGHWASRRHTLTSVVDRVGGGDAFAAGLLHGLIAGYSPQHTVEFAMAASAIKHSIPGDWNLTNLAEVEDTVSETGLDIRR